MELVDLERLHEDRNRCAHPTYQGVEQPYTPGAELARTHLVHAVRHVLSQVPVQGKAATAQIIRLVESEYFPTDLEQAKVQLKKAGMDRARDSLVRSVVDHLVFGYVEGEQKIRGRPQTAVAIRAMGEMFPDLCEPRIKRAVNTMGRNLRDPQLVYFIGLLKFYVRVWEFLEEDNQTRMKELVRLCLDDIAQHALPICLEIKDMESVCSDRLKKLPQKELAVVSQKTKHPLVIDAGVTLYCGSGTWDSANANYKIIEPVIEALSQNQIRRILRARVAESADLPGSHSFNAFCRHIYNSEKLPKTEILELLNGCDAGFVARELIRDPEEDIPF